MARYMAVYEQKQSMLAQGWHGFKIVCKLAFWLAIGWLYFVIGFSL
jgi:hypothetical protein